MPLETDNGSGDGAKGIERAARILYYLSRNPDKYGVRELARQLSITKSTMQRMLNSLESEGLAVMNPLTQKYGLGYGIVELASSLLKQGDLPSVSLPFLQRLRDLTSETTCLHVRVGNRRVTLLQLESPQELRFTVEIGKGYPLYTGASGKALMAYLSEAEIERIIESGLLPLTPNSEVDPERLREKLRLIRERGYAVSSGERVKGGAGIAAPVRDAQGQVVASISVYAPEVRLPGGRILELIPVVQETATGISAALGQIDLSQVRRHQ